MPAGVAIVVTDQGTASGQVANPTLVSITTAANISSGSLIAVCVEDLNIGNVAIGTVSDSQNGSTYTTAITGKVSGGNRVGGIFYKFNSAALTGGVDTISYGTNDSNANTIRVSAFSATGILSASDPGQAAVAANGNSAAPSVTSGSPTATGELFAGCVINAGNSQSYTQDSTNAAWAAPFTPSTSTNPNLFGGSVVNAGSGALIYAPTLSIARAWAAYIVAFKHP
jgi:hypothetical protein